VREDYHIEYKQAVLRDGKERQDKVDFLASVTSFANTIGGDLLIGVESESGLPVGLAGWQGVDVDKAKLRIEHLLRDLVEPRVAFTIREIPLANGNTVLVLRVPWSWAQPHMVRVDQVNRFYYRHSAGKDIMNVAQLRAAFALTTRLEEQVRRFRDERIKAIKNGTDGRLTPPPAPTVVVHVVPFESLRAGFTLDLEATMKIAQGGLLPLGTGSNGHVYTLDGIFCFDDLPTCNVYTQVFRKGIMETASRRLLAHPHGKKLIPCGAIPRDVLGFVRSAIAFYQRISVPPPFVVMMSIIGVQGFEFATSTELGVGYYTHRVDRDDLVLPEVLVQDVTTSPTDLCRPMFDTLFNAAGFAKWPEYEAYKRHG
jgi:Putative DNA-binding domain